MEEQELDIVEFRETFTREWLEQKLRGVGMYGGLQSHLIPLKSEGYLLPRRLEQAVEGYIVYRYKQETGGVVPISSQEIVYIPNGTYKDVEVLCQGMYVPAQQAPKVVEPANL